ncbi:hypothetical protein AHAS_Ahas14G0148100 [Arachis hypogaea]
MLDTSINLIDARCTAFLDDLTTNDQRKIKLAYTFFSFFTAVGSVLDYFAAFFRRFEVTLSFTVTKACNRLCTWWRKAQPAGKGVLLIAH